jgi:hypothetical protein
MIAPMRDPKFNLWLQIALGVLLTLGALLARRGWYRAHGACQATAYALTVLMTAIWMLPVFVKLFAPNLIKASIDKSDAIATLHATLGTTVLLLGAYVILVATSVVPPRFRFSNYRPWMRTLFALWWTAIAIGIWTYFVSA